MDNYEWLQYSRNLRHKKLNINTGINSVNFFSGLVFIFLIVIEISLIYNAVLLSGVQQSKSVLYTHTHTHTHTYIYIHSFLRFLSHIGHYRMLSSVPHTISRSLCACMHAKSIQSSLTLCDPMVCSLPGSSVHGILQARILEWVAMPSSSGSS